MSADHSVVIAVDPSVVCTGVAVFVGGELRHTFAVKDSSRKTSPFDRSVRVALAAGYWFSQREFVGPITLAVEWPQIYRGHKQKTNPSLLFGLSSVCGAMGAMLELLTDSDVKRVAYSPKEWSGGIKKTIRGDFKKSPRARLIHARLNEGERSLWDGISTHDEIDAVGIGMHHLGRLIRRQVFPGATE